MEKRRCPGCMAVTEQAVCEKCGWPQGRNNEVHQLPVGTRLRGQYIIGRALGQGGFGITYLGWDDMLDMPVAIKEFYPNAVVARDCTVTRTVHCTTEKTMPQYEASKERFLREAKALARLRDVPEVVGVYSFFEENGTAYIIMEYVKGTDLATYIARKGGRLSPEETFRILRPVMEALEMVHQADLVHRDISPDNIMLHPRGGAKLLDFGAVRNVEGAEAGVDMAHSTEAILKHGFAPAEQYKSRGGLGPWSDEYAMCATVYYCLTCRIPPQAVERMLEDVEVSFDIPGLPAHQRKALEKGMAIRSKDRHGSMKKLMEALFPAEEPASAPVKAEPVRTPAVAAPAAEFAAPAPAPAPVVEEPVEEPKCEAPVTAPVEPVAAPKKASKPAAADEATSAPVKWKNDNRKKPVGLAKILIPVAALLVLALVIFDLIPRGWKNEYSNRYYYVHGQKVTSSWMDIDGDVYWFDQEGKMATGWRTIDGETYWFDSDGKMAKGEVSIDGKYYDLGADGKLQN